MDNIIFRTATLEDVPAIVKLLADDKLGSQREVVSSALHEKYIAAFNAIESCPNQQLIVAISEATVVGTLQLSFIPGISRLGAWRGQIEAVRVAASHRSSGLGQTMFQWALEQCKSHGCEMVQLTADKNRSDAHRFYEKLGFIASHEGYKLFF